jgi:hypothetical protein
MGLGLLVVFFPLWRLIASRSPELATEVLDEIQIDRPVHPAEPSSNVRRIEG